MMSRPDWLKIMEKAAEKTLADVLQDMDIEVCDGCSMPVTAISCLTCDEMFEEEIKETEYQTKKRREKNEHIARNNK